MNLELVRIWSQSRKTVFFITHSIAEAIFLSDRVIAMTARPGTIADVIFIDLPRPRDLSVINTERFGRYAAHLRSLLDATGGDSALAAAAYYQGLASVQEGGEEPATEQYVENVLALRQQFGGE